MNWIIKTLCAFVIATPVWADGEVAGDFDYYVLSLSWIPNWCELEGDERGAPECRQTGRGWSVHGLWPQYENGWPSYCRTTERDPSRAMTGAQTDVFGSSGLAWYQWQKHGRCSGLSAEAYYDAARAAFKAVEMPDILRRIADEMSLHPDVVEAAFLEVNPNLDPDGITITCKAGLIQEARICLTKDLDPRICGRNVIRDCTMSADFFPLR